jgi:hypothetical protein
LVENLLDKPTLAMILDISINNSRTRSRDSIILLFEMPCTAPKKGGRRKDPNATSFLQRFEKAPLHDKILICYHFYQYNTATATRS